MHIILNKKNIKYYSNKMSLKYIMSTRAINSVYDLDDYRI